MNATNQHKAFEEQARNLESIIKFLHTPEFRKIEICRSEKFNLLTQAFYCIDGFASVTIDEEMHLLKKGELLTSTGKNENFSKLGIMGEGKLLRVQILFDEAVTVCDEPKLETQMVQKQKLIKEKQPSITAEDIKWSALICWSNFRGGKKLFKMFHRFSPLKDI